MAATLGQRLAKLGWQSGSVVPAALYGDIKAHLATQSGTIFQPVEADWLIAITQTCDILASNLEQEPHAEFLWCRPVGAPRAQFRDLRSTRRLDFRPNRGAFPDTVLSVHAAHDRYHVSRSVLESNAPRTDRTLSVVAVRRLQAWLSLRYSRAAWPDSFVARISPAREKFIEILETLGHDDVAEIRVALTPYDAELHDNEIYRLLVYFVVDEDVWNRDPATRHRIQAAFGDFIGSIEHCNGVDIDGESGVVSGAVFTWQQVQITEPWNFASLTWRD